ncbi:MAG TPA: hypothetical protein VGP85_24295 [Pyrinomonadaceae bacterium]|jgi:hypothetical protein|nr:hypothetical protein [Pyrinomonadaceae bacterium]HEV8137822.1 hypothetical protein [Pyrinomonadaceae bacterium]
MAKELLTDALWARIAPLLPAESPKSQGDSRRLTFVFYHLAWALEII